MIRERICWLTRESKKAVGTKSGGLRRVREKTHSNMNSSKLEPLKKTMLCLALALEVRKCSRIAVTSLTSLRTTQSRMADG